MVSLLRILHWMLQWTSGREMALMEALKEWDGQVENAINIAEKVSLDVMELVKEGNEED